MDEENEAAHRAWVRWMNGDAGVPIWGIALMHDLVACFYKEASANERLAMIGRFPILVEAYSVAWWIADPFRLTHLRIAPFFEQMPPEKRLELTALRGELERYLLRKRGVDI